MINLGSTKTGLLLLWGLFAYDIFWVFATPVMVRARPSNAALCVMAGLRLNISDASTWQLCDH